MKARLREIVRQFALWLLAWVDACPICGAPWAEHRCPYKVSAAASKRRCGICLQPLPVDAMQKADGKWRCSAHKGQ